jgi:hypothetical protein
MVRWRVLAAFAPLRRGHPSSDILRHAAIQTTGDLASADAAVCPRECLNCHGTARFAGVATAGQMPLK